MKVLLTAAFLLILSLSAQAQTVTFAWDPDTEAITGFRLYQSKTSGTYNGPAVATFTPGTLVTGQIAQPGLGRYFFVLRAFKDDSGFIVESDNSNEVTLVVKPKPPKLNSAILAAIKAPIDLIKWVMRGNREGKGLRVVS